MPAPVRTLVMLAALLAGIVMTSGCTDIAVGAVRYDAGVVSLDVTNNGVPADAFVQLTIFRIEGFSQTEYRVVMKEVSLGTGQETLTIPAELPPGSYKIYGYVIRNGERKTAVIRDIEVR